MPLAADDEKSNDGHSKTHFLVGLNLAMGIVALIVSIIGLVLVFVDRQSVKKMHDIMRRHMETCDMLKR